MRIIKNKSAATTIADLFVGSSVSACDVPLRTWKHEQMEKAFAAVEKGTSIRKAAELYGVPRSTLHDRVSGRVELGCKPGKKPYLTIEEEEEVVSFLLKCAKIGYAHTRKEVIALIQRIAESKGVSQSVSSGWWTRFSQRHPDLALRTAMPVSYARAMANDPDVINRYYDILEETLIENKLFNEPHRLFNCDETGLPLNPKPLKVVDAKKAKNPSYLTGGDKSQVTVLACTNATGMVLPPFVIFDRQTLNPQMTIGDVPGTLYGLSTNGWITQDLFNEWFHRHFLLYAPSERPLLLLLDGHSSHYCPDFIRTAAASQVIVFVLPPHTTHLTQPLDKSAFSALKVAWRQVCHEFAVKNPGRVVSRYDFSNLFCETWGNAMTIKTVTSGFRVTGVYPFDRKAITFPETGYKAFKPDRLPNSHGIAYLPLYSPSSRSMSMRASTPVEDESSDLDSLIDSSLDKCALLKPSKFRTLSAFLKTPQPPSKIPTVNMKSSGKVLTSIENIRKMEAREKEKQEKLRLKEERKKLREGKKKVQVKSKKKENLSTEVNYGMLFF